LKHNTVDSVTTRCVKYLRNRLRSSVNMRQKPSSLNWELSWVGS